MHPTALLLSLTLAAGPLDMPTVEGVEIRQEIRPYTIEGNTARDIFSQMQAKGWLDAETGRREFGHTQADLGWTYDLTRTADGQCSIGAVRVQLDVSIVLPDWRWRRKPDPRLAAQWRSFSDALAHHEGHHRDLAIDTAVALRRALEELPPARCDAMPLRIDAVTSRLVARMLGDNRRYDRDTDHGRTEGAFWLVR